MESKEISAAQAPAAPAQLSHQQVQAHTPRTHTPAPLGDCSTFNPPQACGSGSSAQLLAWSSSRPDLLVHEKQHRLGVKEDFHYQTTRCNSESYTHL